MSRSLFRKYRLITRQVTLTSRTSSTSSIQREEIQAKGHRGSNQKSAPAGGGGRRGGRGSGGSRRSCRGNPSSARVIPRGERFRHSHVTRTAGGPRHLGWQDA